MKIKILFLFLLLSTSAFAGYSEGVEFYNKQQYSSAFSELKPLADKNNEQAQYYIAYMYLNGYGVSQDIEKGLEYLNKSAQQGYVKAETLLGYYYSEGKYVNQDKKKAFDFYTSAAHKEDDEALLNLGLMYYLGDGTEINIPYAYELLGRVDPSAAPTLGRRLADIYRHSEDEKLRTRARDLYKQSASKEDMVAVFNLAQLEQETKNAEKAQEYYRYAASQGLPEAQFALAALYLNGDGVEKDEIKGYAWVLLAANQRYEPAQELQEQMESNIPLSKQNKIRDVVIELQQTVLGKLTSPFSDILKMSLSGSNTSPTTKPVKKIRRPRSRARGGN